MLRLLESVNFDLLGGDGGGSDSDGTEGEEVDFYNGEGARGGGKSLKGGCDGSGQRGWGGVDGIGGEGAGEQGGGGGDAALGEDGAEFFESAVGAHAGGVFLDSKFVRDLGMGFVLVKTEQDERAVIFGEFVDGAVDFWCELVPGFGGVVHGIEGGGGLFAFLAADFGANVIDGCAVGFAVEPGGERKGGRDFLGLFDEAEEDGLGDVASGFIVGGDASGHGMDERKVSVNERDESAVRGIEQVLAKEVMVADWHVSKRNRQSIGKANEDLEKKEGVRFLGPESIE